MRAAASAGAGLLGWSLGSGFFLLLLGSLFQVDGVPVWVAVGICALAPLAWMHPAAALLLTTSLVPLATWAGRTWNESAAWPEIVATAYLAGYCAQRARAQTRSEQPPADWLSVAIYLLTAVTLASAVVQFLAADAISGPEQGKAELAHLLSFNYFTAPPPRYQDAALRFIQGLLLLHAAFRLSWSLPRLGPQVMRAVVLAGAAAGAANLWRLWIGALRTPDPIEAFGGYLATLRFNTHYGDVNAAGSYFMMALIPAVFLCRERWRWAAAVGLIGSSLFLSGSRAAMASGVVAAALAWWLLRRRHDRGAARRLDLRTALTIGVLVLMVLGGAFLLTKRNVTPAASALWIRAEFTRTSLAMFRSAPVFGVGIGSYTQWSGHFSSPELLAVYPPANGENAHNNFLQVLCELGLVGFTLFGTVLLGAIVLAIRSGGTAQPSRLLQGAVGGALAFAGTWIAGHPLLVTAPAYSFWLLLGATAGWRLAAAGTITRRAIGPSLTRATAVALVLLALSVPLRVRAQLASADLEHYGIGLSDWHQSEDGVRHRVAGVESTVFVPSVASALTIPLRAVAGEQPLLVELWIDGSLANVVPVTSDRWRQLHLPAPADTRGQRSRRLELRVQNAPASESSLLLVGKITWR